jgi:hypothetical protein
MNRTTIVRGTLAGVIRLFVAAALLATLAAPLPAQAATAVDDTANTAFNTPVIINVLANDLDDLDAVFANSTQRNRRCLGDGAGGFACADVSADTNASEGVALGDLDGDGNLDAVFANWGQRNRRCLGDGAGGFSACADVSADTNLSLGVALGDLDGDGNLDAVFANRNQANRRCLGDGAGGFSACADVSADTNLSYGVALGDLDGDGNLDAVFANFNQRNRRCLGDGAGGFACADVSADTNLSWGVALGDLDGDGNLDAVFANSTQRNRRCLGDGAGGFACADVSADTNTSYGVALGLLGLDVSSVTVVVAPANGAAVVNADGTITYTPNPGFSGVDTFTYSVEGSTATVTVNVAAPPAPPPAEEKEEGPAPTPTPVPPPQAQEFNCWPWLVIVPPQLAPKVAPGQWCQASLGKPLPVESTFRYLGHSTDVVVKDEAGQPITVFAAAPLRVCFRYTPPELSAVDGDPTRFLIQTFRDGKWEALDTRPDPTLPQPGVCVSVDHLTLFALFARDAAAPATPVAKAAASAKSNPAPAPSAEMVYPNRLPETGLPPVSPWTRAVGVALFGAALGAGAWLLRRRFSR